MSYSNDVVSLIESKTDISTEGIFSGHEKLLDFCSLMQKNPLFYTHKDNTYLHYVFSRCSVCYWDEIKIFDRSMLFACELKDAVCKLKF